MGRKARQRALLYAEVMRQICRSCRGNYAFVSTLRSPEYLILLKELHCSLMQHNPGARLVVVGVIGELDQWVIREFLALGNTEWREVEDFVMPNWR